MQIVRLVPVEYLTYGIRDVSDIERLVGADDLAQPSATKERYGCGTPLAGAVRPTEAQSISTTSPVCSIRICIAFLLVWDVLCTNQPPGKIQEGAPARIQRSDSCGKRRNNETDELSRLRGSEGCVVCSDANPPLAFSFYRQRLFLCRAKKKGLNSAATEHSVDGYGRRQHTPYDNFHGDGSSHHRVALSAFLPSKEGNREHPAFHAEKAAGI